MKKFKEIVLNKLFIEGVIAILFYYFITELFTQTLSSVFISFFDREYIVSHNDMLNAIFQVIMYVFLFLQLVFWFKDSLKSDLAKTRKEPNKFFINILIGFVLFYLANILSSIIINLGNIEDSENQKVIEELIKSSNIGMVSLLISAVLLGPLVEELIFRKAIFQVCKNNALGLILSTFLFGLIHILSTDGTFLYKLIVGTPYFFSGLAFGITYIKSDRNIYVTTAIHMASNLLSLILIIETASQIF